MEKSSFFNSVNGDRKYKAEDFAAYFGSFISNGIFPNPADNLRVISNNDMTVTLKPGKAWINGYFYMNDDDLILPIDVADGVLDRIDRVVIRLDYVNREIRAVVKKGTFASSPVAPELQRDMDIYELCVAEIKVSKGAVSILQSDITDTRLNLELCGVTNSLITVDVGIITEQFSKDFTEWFERVKGQLGEDPAGNLQNQIDALNQNKISKEDFDEHLADKVAHWKFIDRIILTQDTAQVDVSLPSGKYNELRILVKNVSTIQTNKPLKLFFNNTRGLYLYSYLYLRYLSSPAGKQTKDYDIELNYTGIGDGICALDISVLGLQKGEMVHGEYLTVTKDEPSRSLFGLFSYSGTEEITSVNLSPIGDYIKAGATIEVWGR